MAEPIDSLAVYVKEPEPWDLASEPPAVPIAVQEKAIEELLQSKTGTFELPIAEAPADLLADATSAPAEIVVTNEEFKPTDEEWQNVKAHEIPQTPAHKLEVLERDAQGNEAGGDWTSVKK